MPLTKTRHLLFSFLFALAIPHPAHASNWTFGVEGFEDRYREPAPYADVTDNSGYGSVTATYAHPIAGPAFFAADGRASFGLDSYHSSSGTGGGVPQYEGDFRLRGGWQIPTVWGPVSPFAGVGARLFLDNGNDDGGFYNRRIEQLYAPVGVSWQAQYRGLNIAPAVEYDQLIRGFVKSSLHNFTGYDTYNIQRTGHGARAELMVGPASGRYQWQVGPFVRYWDIRTSNVYTGPDGQGWIEPHNTRIQTGLALRIAFP